MRERQFCVSERENEREKERERDRERDTFAIKRMRRTLE